MKITLQQLKVFVTVAQLKNISHTAQALKLSQSTVSFHLHTLEEFTGLPLFSSNRYPKVLTEAGTELLQYAKSLTDLADEMERVITDFRHNRRRKLRIGTSHVPATYLVPMIVQSFHQAFPHVHLHVEVMPTPEVRRRLHAHQLDIGFILDDDPVPVPLVGIPVLQDEIICVFSPKIGFQWLTPPIAADQLNAVPLISHHGSSATARIGTRWAQEQGVNLNPAITLGSIEMIKTAVKLGMGAALLSKMMVLEDIERNELLFMPLQNPPFRHLRLIFRQDLKNAITQNFIEMARALIITEHVGPSHS